MTYEYTTARVHTRILQGIKCLFCRRTSWNPNDVRHRYCGYCHIFHDDYPQSKV